MSPDSLPRAHDWESYKKLVKIVATIAAFVVAIAWLYRPILLGVVAATIIAYIADPIVDRICGRSPFSRKRTVGLLIFLSVLVLSLIGILVIPFIYEETLHILRMIPDAVTYLETLLKPVARRLSESRLIPEEAVAAGLRRITALPDYLSTESPVQRLVVQGRFMIEFVFNLAMIPAFVYILLAEFSRITQLLKSVVPNELHELGGTFISKVNRMLRAVVKGQFIVAFILSIFYMIGFSIIGVPSGVAIGALAGFCRIVPYFDVLVGIILCTIVILTQGAGLAVFIGVLVVITIVQSLDGLIVTPRIIGDRAGLHPIAVITSVYAFGAQFGLLGVLLAVPVVAATVVIVKLSWPFFKQSYFFCKND